MKKTLATMQCILLPMAVFAVDSVGRPLEG